MLLPLLLLVFGVIALVKGEFNVTKKRRVSKSGGRALGVVMILGAFIFPFAALIIAIVVGLALSEPTEPGEQGTNELLKDHSRKKFYSGFLVVVGMLSLLLGSFSGPGEFTIAGVAMILAGVGLGVYIYRLGHV